MSVGLPSIGLLSISPIYTAFILLVFTVYSVSSVYSPTQQTEYDPNLGVLDPDMADNNKVT